MITMKAQNGGDCFERSPQMEQRLGEYTLLENENKQVFHMTRYTTGRVHWSHLLWIDTLVKIVSLVHPKCEFSLISFNNPVYAKKRNKNKPSRNQFLFSVFIVFVPLSLFFFKLFQPLTMNHDIRKRLCWKVLFWLVKVTHWSGVFFSTNCDFTLKLMWSTSN